MVVHLANRNLGMDKIQLHKCPVRIRLRAFTFLTHNTKQLSCLCVLQKRTFLIRQSVGDIYFFTKQNVMTIYNLVDVRDILNGISLFRPMSTIRETINWNKPLEEHCVDSFKFNAIWFIQVKKNKPRRRWLFTAHSRFVGDTFSLNTFKSILYEIRSQNKYKKTVNRTKFPTNINHSKNITLKTIVSKYDRKVVNIKKLILFVNNFTFYRSIISNVSIFGQCLQWSYDIQVTIFYFFL